MLASIVVPVTPIILGAIFLNEHLGLRDLAGGSMIALALVVIDGRVGSWALRGIAATGKK